MLGKMLLEPSAERGVEVVGVIGQDDEVQAASQRSGRSVSGSSPRDRFAILSEHDDAELAGDFLAAADDVADFGRELLDVLAVLEQLVILRVARSLPSAFSSSLNTRRLPTGWMLKLFSRMSAISAANVLSSIGCAAVMSHLQFGWLGTVDPVNAQGAEPQGADDVGSVGDILVWVLDGSPNGFEIAPRLFEQCPVEIVGDRTQAARSRCPLSLVMSKSAAVMTGDLSPRVLNKSTRMRIKSRVSCASVATRTWSSSKRMSTGEYGHASTNSVRRASCWEGGISARRRCSSTCGLMRALMSADGHVEPVLENAVEQQALPVLLRLGSLKIHEHGLDAVNLLDMPAIGCRGWTPQGRAARGGRWRSRIVIG